LGGRSQTARCRENGRSLRRRQYPVMRRLTTGTTGSGGCCASLALVIEARSKGIVLVQLAWLSRSRTWTLLFWLPILRHIGPPSIFPRSVKAAEQDSRLMIEKVLFRQGIRTRLAETSLRVAFFRTEWMQNGRHVFRPDRFILNERTCLPGRRPFYSPCVDQAGHKAGVV
jgi:hypothetical protein